MKIQRGDQLTKEEMKWYVSFNNYCTYILCTLHSSGPQSNLYFFGLLFMFNEIVDFPSNEKLLCFPQLQRRPPKCSET